MPVFKPSDRKPIKPFVYSKPVTPVQNTASQYIDAYETKPLLKYIDGARWTVDYYNRYMGTDDLTHMSRDITSNTILQYRLLYRFELRVVDQLSFSRDEDTGRSKIEGSANVYPVFTPQTGDLFIGTVDQDQNKGIFEVTHVEKLTLYKDTAYKISYNLRNYVSEELLKDLNSKVTDEVVFDKELIGSKLGAFKTLSEYERDIVKKEKIEYLMKRLYREFYDIQYKVFRLPTNIASYKDSLIVDPFMQSFLNHIFDPLQLNTLHLPEYLDFMNDTRYTKRKYFTLWDILIERDKDLFSLITPNMTILSTNRYSNETIHFNNNVYGYDYIVFPLVDDVVDTLLGQRTHLLHPYIFSNYFYDGQPKTPIEVLVYKSIELKAINFSEVMSLVDGLSSTDRMSLYYHIPLLIYLLRLSE